MKPGRKVYVGSNLNQDMRGMLIGFLKANEDYFAMSHADMKGIPPDVMSHKLNEDPSFTLRNQKKRKKRAFTNQVIQNEVQKLLKIGSIREVKYPNWLANKLVVPKYGKWRVWADYTDINKAFPKDSCPLPHIDLLIDATAGHKLLNFLDAYSGYNQIKMDPGDKENTSFITDTGAYCYKVMPCGLKNVGATYHRVGHKNVSRTFRKKCGGIYRRYDRQNPAFSRSYFSFIYYILNCTEI